MTGAIPSLAPGALVELGLIGLAYAYIETHARKRIQTQENVR
jgi:hypothetical protein